MLKHVRFLLLSSLLVVACSSPENRVRPGGTAGAGGGGTAGVTGTAGAAGAGATTGTAGDNGSGGAGTTGTGGDAGATSGTAGAGGDTAGAAGAAGASGGTAGTAGAGTAGAGTAGAAGTTVDAAADAPTDAGTSDAPRDTATTGDTGTDAATTGDAASDTGTGEAGTVGEYSNFCSPVHWTITANPAAVHLTDYPTNIVDGSNATRWSTGGNQVNGQYIQIDFGGTVSLTQVVLDDTDNVGDYPRGYDVGLSTNGTTFTSVATGTPATAVVTINFAAAQGRYLRVTQTGAVANYWSIDELRVACTIPGFNPDAGLVRSLRSDDLDGVGVGAHHRRREGHRRHPDHALGDGSGPGRRGVDHGRSGRPGPDLERHAELGRD